MAISTAWIGSASSVQRMIMAIRRTARTLPPCRLTPSTSPQTLSGSEEEKLIGLRRSLRRGRSASGVVRRAADSIALLSFRFASGQ
jgi:hypothetical protein